MKKQQEKRKDLTYEQLISSPQYTQLREQILKDINTFCLSLSFEVFKKNDKEKAELLTAKKNWKGNDKEFYKEFMTNQLPNWGTMKFQGIQL